MASAARKNGAWLLANAKAVATQLVGRKQGTSLRIRLPKRTTTTNTDGWCAVIGDLGKGQPKLEIWLDRFSGYPERKLFACFRHNAREPLASITRHVSRKLWPTRIVSEGDTDESKFLVLSNRLERAEFNLPILEKYENESTFFGMYDPTRDTDSRINPHFVARATAFFEDVARALPSAAVADENREVFPRCENRQWVASHLHRERSRLLAAECKIRDDYQCQVCGARAEELYGKALGYGYAEAHHLVPLNRLRGEVKTRLEDLRTVCANCHRMLHRMAGRRDDVTKLRAIVQRHRRK